MVGHNVFLVAFKMAAMRDSIEFHFLNLFQHSSFCRYSFEGILQAIYGFDRGTLDCNGDHCIFEKATDVLKMLDVEHAEFYIDFIVLCVFFVLLRIGIYFVLRWRVKAR